MSDDAVDWHKEALSAIVKGAETTISRARYVFIVINVASVIVLVGQFNAVLSLVQGAQIAAETAAKNAAKKAAEYTTKNNPEFATLQFNEHINLAYSQSLEHLYLEDLLTTSVPLLGIKVWVSDLSVIASTAFLILVIWQYYCVRRENDVVTLAFEEANKALARENKDCAAYLYHGVAHNFVFTTPGYSPVGSRNRFEPTAVFLILYFMPAWIPLLLVGTDATSLFLSSHYEPSKLVFQSMGKSELIDFTIRMAYAAILGLFTLYYCYRGLFFERDTNAKMGELMKKLL